MTLAILKTASGFWNPLAFVAFFIGVCIIIFIFRAFGKKDFKPSKYKADVFFSGNIASEASRVKASDLFWGFFEAMKPYYNLITKIHTGIINDYALWYVIVASLLLTVLTLGVLQWT